MNEMVVGIGEILWDMLPGGKKIGGAPANFAYHVSQFGLPGCAASAVGDDTLGKELIRDLSGKGMSTLIPETPYATGTVLVKMSKDGIPEYDIRENVAWDHIPFSSELEALARNTVALCFGSLAQRGPVSRATIRRFLNTMPRTQRSLIVFDANLRQSFYTAEILRLSMQRCNILKINDEELPIVCHLCGCPDSEVREKCLWLLDRFNLKMLILTCGINGSYVFSPTEISFRPTPRVEVADTVGAGDSFTAAFTACLLKGATMREAHAVAVNTSAFVCSQAGAMPPLPPSLTSL